MPVVGTADIDVHANTAGFAAEVENADLSGIAGAGEKAGVDAGEGMRQGVKTGASGIEEDMSTIGTNSGQKLEAGATKGAGGIKNMLSSLGVPSFLLSGWGELGVAVVGVAASAIDLGEKMQDSDVAIANASGTTVKSATAIGNAFLDTAGKSEYSGQTQAAAFAQVAGVLKSTQGSALDTAQATTFMSAASDLAAAKQIDLGSATKTLAGVMQAFKLTSKDAAGATNLLYNASTATGQGVDAVGGALEKMKSHLGGLSPPLADLAANMVDLQDNGVTGKAAVTGVSSAMTALAAIANPTTKATQAQAAALASYGLSATQANGQLTPLSTIIDTLGPKYAAMNQSQQIATSTTLFGAGAAKTMTAAIDGGSSVMTRATKAINEQGTAQAAAGKQSQTMGSEIKTIKATIEDWLTQLGQRLIPVLGTVVKVIAQDLVPDMKIFVGGLIDVGKHIVDVGKFIADHKVLLVALATAVGAVLVPALVSLGVSLGVAAGAFAIEAVQAAAAWIATMGPIALVVAAIAGVAAGVYEIIDHWGDIEKFFKQLWGDIKGIFDDAWDHIKAPVMDVIDYIRTHWQMLLAIITGPFGLAALAVKDHLDDIKQWASDAVNDITGFFTAIPGEISSALATVGSDIEDAFDTAYDWINNNLIKPVLSLFTSLPGNIVSALGNIVTTIWGGLTSAASWVDTNVIKPVIALFTSLPSEVVSTLGSIVTTIWSGLTGAATWVDTNVINPVVSFFSGLPSAIAGTLTGFIGTVFGGLTGAWNWIDTNVYQPIVSGFSHLPSDIGTAISGAISGLGNIGTDIVNWIIDGMNDAINFYDNHRPSVLGVSLLPYIHDIPKLAEGGIATQPTLALIGESGPEAVIPLSQYQVSLGGSAGMAPLESAFRESASSSSGSGGTVTVDVHPGAFVLQLTVANGDPPNAQLLDAVDKMVKNGFDAFQNELAGGVTTLRSATP